VHERPGRSLLVGSDDATHQITSAVPVQSIGNFPPSPDPMVDYDFSWTPDSTVVSTGPDPGHVCLLAQAYCVSTDCVAPRTRSPGMTADPTDPRTAIHNIHVQDPTPGMIRRWPHRTWPFFFAATNGAGINGRTRLVARAYDPAHEADRARILDLAGLPAVRAALGRCAKFALPAEVHLGIGTETVVAPPGAGVKFPAPRLGFTGTVQPELAADLVRGAWTKVAHASPASHDLEMVARQATQAAVHVVPHDEEGHIYAVEVRHELLTGKEPIVMGGLTVVFTTLCRPW
jgi:hypothetical protein